MTKNIKSKITKEQRAAFAVVGRMGGLANAKKGKKYMSELGKKAAAKRWGLKTG